MAAQGGPAFLEKVSRMLRAHNGKPVLKSKRPLALKDSVANRKPRRGEATCITEMSVMMACWKENNFVDSLCSKEIDTFYTCVKESREAMKKKKSEPSFQGGHLLPKEATTLLKRYPNQRTEI